MKLIKIEDGENSVWVDPRSILSIESLSIGLSDFKSRIRIGTQGVIHYSFTYTADELAAIINKNL